MSFFRRVHCLRIISLYLHYLLTSNNLNLDYQILIFIITDLVHRLPLPAASMDSTVAPTPSCPRQETARSPHLKPGVPGVPSGPESRIQSMTVTTLWSWSSPKPKHFLVIMYVYPIDLFIIILNAWVLYSNLLTKIIFFGKNTKSDSQNASA